MKDLSQEMIDALARRVYLDYVECSDYMIEWPRVDHGALREMAHVSRLEGTQELEQVIRHGRELHDTLVSEYRSKKGLE